MLTSFFALFYVFLLGFANAAPMKRTELIAYGPVITQPTHGANWTLGSYQLVEWRTDVVPKEAQYHTVKILLGRPNNSSENLDTEHPLADYIPIMQGWATVMVPVNIPTGDGYVVATIGVSDDLSPMFTISAS